MEGFVDCLGGENDEGEDVTNKTKAGHEEQQNSFHDEGERRKPHDKIPSWIELTPEITVCLHSMETEI